MAPPRDKETKLHIINPLPTSAEQRGQRPPPPPRIQKTPTALRTGGLLEARCTLASGLSGTASNPSFFAAGSTRVSRNPTPSSLAPGSPWAAKQVFNPNSLVSGLGKLAPSIPVRHPCEQKPHRWPIFTFASTETTFPPQAVHCSSAACWSPIRRHLVPRLLLLLRRLLVPRRCCPSSASSAAFWSLVYCCPEAACWSSEAAYWSLVKKRKTEAEVGPEGGRSMRPGEILNSEAQIILAMVGAGKAWSALRFNISAYCVKEDITGRKACGAKKWAALEGWAIAHPYLKRLKPLFDNPSAIGNDVRRAVRFLCSDTLKKKKQGRAVADAQMVELFEDARGDGGGPVETARNVERIGLRVYITDPDAIADFVPGKLPPGYSGYGWGAAAFSCKTSMFSLPLRIEDILRYASKHHQGRTARALWGASDDPGEEGISHRFEINITDEDELHGWYSAQTCLPPRLMVVLHRANDDANEEWESPPPRGEPPWFPVDREQAAPEPEEELDPPVSDSEVEKPRKRRTGIPKLNRTFEERLAKSRRRLNREFDYRDVLKRHHKAKFPNAIHLSDDDWAADERQVFDPVASADRRAARVGRPSMGKSKGKGKGKGKAVEKGKGKAVEKGSERGVKRKAASEPEQDDSDENDDDAHDDDDDDSDSDDDLV
ncbi:hypothetical protein Q9L58_010004 [Maublancomyces gigas]|uniref:Uncharacterized protein n=1 Tax=Discina gigas TaxID=1032678 RepID=A0ABR3G5F0_9PEZI